MDVTLSFDIEEFDFSLERGRDIDFSEQLDVSTEGLESVLALLKKYEIQATFYITANYAINRPDVVREIVKLGHEVASHDYYHGWGRPSDAAGSKRVLEEIAGVEVAGYRSPRLSATSSEKLAEADYRYNSSMNPTFIPFRYNNLCKPRSVFGDHHMINYPASVSYPFRIPLFWISFHVMGLRLYQFLVRSATRKDGHLNIYFHPWEFSNRLNDPKFGVPSYIRRCSGDRLLLKLERFILYLRSKDYRFKTTRDYLEEYVKNL